MGKLTAQGRRESGSRYGSRAWRAQNAALALFGNARLLLDVLLVRALHRARLDLALDLALRAIGFVLVEPPLILFLAHLARVGRLPILLGHAGLFAAPWMQPEFNFFDRRP